MTEGRKPEYPEKTCGDELKKMPPCGFPGDYTVGFLVTSLGVSWRLHCGFPGDYTVGFLVTTLCGFPGDYTVGFLVTTLCGFPGDYTVWVSW